MVYKTLFWLNTDIMPSTILHYGMSFDGSYTGLTPKEGVLIVDPSTNTIRIGDGTTPGGVALAGGGGGGVSNIVEDTTPELGGNLVTGDNLSLIHI